MNDDWGDDGAGDDSTVSHEETHLAPSTAPSQQDITMRMEELSLQQETSHRQNTMHRSHLPALKCFALDVAEEEYDTSMSKHEKELLQAYERSGKASSSEAEVWEGEGYDKPDIKGVDNALIKFQMRVAECPRQCLRYASDAGQTPLRFSDDPSLTPSSPPSCRRCRGQTMFELQLMPATLDFIESDRAIPIRSSFEEEAVPQPQFTSDQVYFDKIGLEFGTVLVYSCYNSCDLGDVPFAEEHLYLHRDTYSQPIMAIADRLAAVSNDDEVIQRLMQPEAPVVTTASLDQEPDDEVAGEQES